MQLQHKWIIAYVGLCSQWKRNWPCCKETHKGVSTHSTWNQQPVTLQFLNHDGGILGKHHNSVPGLLMGATIHMVVERSLLITVQVTPSPGLITQTDEKTSGRRYRHNGVKISLPCSETHFLMSKKALILLTLYHEESLSGRGIGVELRGQRIVYSLFVTWQKEWRKGK